MIYKNKIKILDENLAKKIAAGEVVERPASIVKELIENSIDAGSNNISIEIKNGGKDYISVSDNGCGINKSDTKLAFIRHATSKIESMDDLYSINQMGFRGEALYSISAVSKVTLISKTENEDAGSYVKVEGGGITKSTEYGCPNGTMITVEDLFYNTPARYKFLKTTSSETSHISFIIQKYILSHPQISFKFVNNGKLIYFSNGDGMLKNSVLTVYGSDIANNIIEFDIDEVNELNIKIKGCLGNRNILGKNRNNQIIFVNNRYVKDKKVSSAIENLYKQVLMKHDHAFFIINIIINPLFVDVNVHPQKLNVIFSDERKVIDIITKALETRIKEMEQEPVFLNIDKIIEKQSKKTEKKTAETNGINISDKNITPIKEQNNLDDSVQNDSVQDDFKYTEKTNDINESVKKNSFNLKDELHSYNYKTNLVLDKKGSSNVNVLKQPNFAIEMEQQEVELKNITSDFKVIGSALNSYLFVECNDDIYVIDQHAAHERLIYEDFNQLYSQKNVSTQKLLIPQEIELTYDDIILISNNKDTFNNMGYNIEVNDRSINVLGVPVILGQPQLKGFFMEVVEEIRDINYDKMSIEEKLISMSCKKAVKAGDMLVKSEIEKLISVIVNQNTTKTCPHGRPFVMILTKHDIEKGFGRIQ